MDPSKLSGDAAEFHAATADVPDILGDPQPAADGQQADPQAAPGGLTIEALETVFGMTFGMIAARIGKDGEFWQLQDPEKKQLAVVWHPILAPLWAKWMADTDGAIVAAVLCTAMTVAPRLMRESARRGSQTASTVTGKSGASFSSQGQPVAASPVRPID